jgi:tRNA(fMet)-specific endonuclease VapC
MILLDTDIVSHLLRPEARPELVQRLREVPVRDRYTSAITIGEILYGLERTGRHEAIRARLETDFIARIEVLPFDLEAARAYGRIKAHLYRTGRPLDEPDLRIASIAASRNLTLITGNDAHFERVPALRTENWLKQASGGG